LLKYSTNNDLAVLYLFRMISMLNSMPVLRKHEQPIALRCGHALWQQSLTVLLCLGVALLAGCDHSDASAARPVASMAESAGSNNDTASIYRVVVQQPEGPPRVIVGESEDGLLLTASCTTCHNSREPNVKNNSANDLDIFHQGLVYAHGSRSCLSCHNPNDYDTLRLADGQSVQYSNVMDLCAQCHGPQTRDYNRGAHGGMTGYWDLTRGPRVRKNCINCHDPHAPAYQSMTPTFKARDRFLQHPASGEDSGHD